jgi:hypothetical protein
MQPLYRILTKQPPLWVLGYLGWCIQTRARDSFLSWLPPVPHDISLEDRPSWPHIANVFPSIHPSISTHSAHSALFVPLAILSLLPESQSARQALEPSLSGFHAQRYHHLLAGWAVYVRTHHEGPRSHRQGFAESFRILRALLRLVKCPSSSQSH